MGHFITGVVDEILTPFNADGSVNYEQTAEMIDWHLSKGIQNFFVNGLGAECHELTTEEKLELLKVIYGRTQGKACLLYTSMGILAAAAAMGASEAARSAAGSKPTAAVDRAV